jgi:hypothetical protein
MARDRRLSTGAEENRKRRRIDLSKPTTASKIGVAKMGVAIDSVDFGDFAPRNEPSCELFAVNRSVQQMALECEVLPDRTEIRNEGLRAFRVSKAAHALEEVSLGDATLAFALRL